MVKSMFRIIYIKLNRQRVPIRYEEPLPDIKLGVVNQQGRSVVKFNV